MCAGLESSRDTSRSDDGNGHGGNHQSETIQEARGTGSISESGRDQSCAVWPQQIRTRPRRAARETRRRIVEPASSQRRGRVMKSPVVKRSIVVAGHKTSVSLEEAFWNGMKEISGLRDMTLSELVGEIDSNRQQGNLSSAIRLFVLSYFRTRAMAAAPGPKPQG